MATHQLVTDWGQVIKYSESVHDSQRFTYTGKILNAQRVFSHVPWLDHFDFCTNMVGYSELLTVGGNTYIHRVIPKAHPISHRGKRFLYARDILSVEGRTPISEGIDRDGRYGVHTTATVTVGYQTVPYKILPDSAVLTSPGVPDESLLKRYITRLAAPAGEYFQLPRGSHRWLSDLTPANQTLGRIINRLDFAYTWHEVPGLPDSLVGAIGKVNSVMFDKFPANNLYLVAIEAVPYKSIIGTTVWDITYRMRYTVGDQPGHNSFLRYKGQTFATVWDTPVTGPANTKVFESVDFHTLFRGPYGWL